MTERKCGNCIYYARQALAKSQGGCRFNPPAVQFVPAGPALVHGQQQMQLVGIWPPVGENDWCGKWKSPETFAVENTFEFTKDN